MKKIELPNEAIWRENRENEMYWFYEEFQKGGNRSHWSMSLYECEPVIKPIEVYEDCEINGSYQEYVMIFKEKGWDSEYKFVFRKYADSDFFMVYLNDESIMDYIEDYDDLAGCCRSAMYYMCSRV